MGQDQLDKLIREKLGLHESPIDADKLWDSISEKSAEEDVEAIVKDKLYLHETPVDNTVLWNNISGHIVSTKSYKSLYIGVLSIIAIALLSYALLQNVSSGNLSTSVATDRITENNNLLIENVEDTDIYNIDNEIIAESENNKEKENSLSLISQNSQEIIKSENINQVNSIAPPSYYNIKENKSVDTQASIFEKEEINYTTSAKDSAIGNINGTTSTTILQSDLRNNISTIIQKEISQLSGLSIMKVMASLSNNQYRSGEYYTDGLPGKDICFRKNKSVECYDYNPKKIHYSILAYTTADYYMKNLSAITELTPENYLNQRKNTQKVQVSNRSGLQFKIRHKSGVYAKFGAEIGFLRERFFHETRDTVTEILPDQLLNIDVDTNGDTTRTYGNAPVTTISNKTWKINNTLRTIGIPVLVGYQNKFNKLNIGFEIGALYNINHNFEGWLLGPTSNPTEVQDYFITSNDLNLTGGININYELSKKYSAFIMSSFRQNINKINQENTNYINQRNTILGIGVGIEMKL